MERTVYTPDQLRLEVIRPVLDKMRLPGRPAEDLLIGIAAQETHLGALGRRQMGGGPGLGLWQMEGGSLADGRRQDGGTHRLVWRWLRKERSSIALAIYDIAGSHDPQPELMVTNDQYACAMARALCLSIPGPLPETLEARAVWYKTYWNRGGKGSAEQFLANWHKYVDGAAVETVH